MYPEQSSICFKASTEKFNDVLAIRSTEERQRQTGSPFLGISQNLLLVSYTVWVRIKAVLKGEMGPLKTGHPAELLEVE